MIQQILQLISYFDSKTKKNFFWLVLFGVSVALLEIFTIKSLSDFTRIISENDVTSSSNNINFILLLGCLICTNAIGRSLIVFGVNKFSEETANKILFHIFNGLEAYDLKRFLDSKESFISIMSSKGDTTAIRILKPIVNFIIYCNLMIILAGKKIIEIK